MAEAKTKPTTVSFDEFLATSVDAARHADCRAIAAMMQTQVLYRPDLQNGIQFLAGSPWLAAPVLMVLAFILSLCSTTDAFVVAQDAIFPASAKLAFLVFGPMLDMKLIFLYSSVLKPKVVFWLGIGLFIAVYAASFAMGPILNFLPK